MSGAGPERPGVVAVVLAAGRSTRFGGQKLLADVKGDPLIRVAVAGVLASKVEAVTVVTGANEAAIRAALAGLDVSFVHNRAYRNGMGTSIAAGVRSLPAGTEAVVVALGDQPIAGELIDELIEAYRSGGVRIVVPEFEGVRGPPVLFGRPLFGELAALEGDRGARVLIEANPSMVQVLAMEGPAPPDIDTPADRSAFEER